MCTLKAWEPVVGIPTCVWRPHSQEHGEQEKKRCPSLCSRADSKFNLFLPLCATWILNGWIILTYTEDNLLYSIYQLKCKSLPETLSWTHPEILSNQIIWSLHDLVKLTHKINYCRCWGLNWMDCAICVPLCHQNFPYPCSPVIGIPE